MGTAGSRAMVRRMRVPSMRPGPAEAADAGAVGFVVAGFEDVGDVEVGGDAVDGGGKGYGREFRTQ